MSMNKHLSLATCKRLKAGGYRQDQWPQTVWVVPEAINYSGEWRVEFWLSEKGVGVAYVQGAGRIREWIAEPPIIDALGTGGVLPWLRDKGIKVAYEEAFVHAPWSALLPTALTYIYSSTPEALVNAALDAMGVL